MDKENYVERKKNYQQKKWKEEKDIHKTVEKIRKIEKPVERARTIHKRKKAANQPVKREYRDFHISTSSTNTTKIFNLLYIL